MGEFFHAVWQHEFLRVALAVGALISVACGVIGSYVVVRRITYVAGGISHSVLGGLGAARYLQIEHGWTWLSPLYGAIAAALLSALLIGWVSLRAKQREDTVIGAIWAIGMAVGVLFIAKTSTYSEDLMSYLFGSILMVGHHDVWLVALLDGVVVVVGMLCYNQFAAVCFDEEFARLRGLNVEFYYLLLLCLTALTVVLLISVVGIVLVIALLTLPVAIAAQFVRTLGQMMIAAVILSILLTSAGLALSYQPNLPAGATTIVLAGAAYLLAVSTATLVRRMRGLSAA